MSADPWRTSLPERDARQASLAGHLTAGHTR